MITFVATSFNEEQHNAPLIDSLLAQKDKNWKAIIYNNGKNTEMKEWVEGFEDSRVVYKESETNTGQWGTLNRQDAVTNLVNTSHIINTSIQDYYLPNAVEEINKALENKSDFVHWQAINHLFRYQILNGEIAWGHIDWGQFCVKTEYLKKIGIVHADNFSSDWHTIHALITSGLVKKVQKIDKILTVHN